MSKHPILETARLRLRPFQTSDAKRVQLLAGDEEIAKATLNIPHPYEDGMAEEWINTLEKQCVERNEYIFALERKDDNLLIGSVSFIVEMQHANAQLGYWVGKEFWNKGYCTEAARAVLNWGFNTLKLHKVYAHHFVHNLSSEKVLIKLGMKLEGKFRHHFYHWKRFSDVKQYGILAEEFAWGRPGTKRYY